MDTYRFHAAGEQQTAHLAAALASFVDAGSVIALDGELGAGKTHFSKSLAQALGVPGIVNSPTFTIIKEYEGASLPFYHMDVYRVSEEEADELGLDDYFFGAGVTLVEWASRIPHLLPDEYLAIQIHIIDADLRELELIPHGDRYRRWCDALKENGIV